MICWSLTFYFFFQSSDESSVELDEVLVPTAAENQQRTSSMRTRQQTASAAIQPPTETAVTQPPAESTVTHPSTEFAFVQSLTVPSKTNDGNKYYFS